MDFQSLSNLQTRELPGSTLSVHSPVLGEIHQVRPIDWGNLWIYGQQIFLAGYLTGGEYQQAVQQQRAHQIAQPPEGWLVHKTLPVATLKPLPDLFERVKAWGAV